MTQAMTDDGPVPGVVTLSGRELAMRRRQAMALHGKAGAGKMTAMARRAAHVVPAGTVATAPAAAAAAAAVVPAALPVTVPAAPSLKPARARREALSRMGKGALPAAQQRSAAQTAARVGRPAAQPLAAAETGQMAPSVVVAPAAATLPAVETAVQSSVARAPVAPTGRALAQARRAVLAKEGKAGMKRVAQAVKIAAAMPEQNWQAAISQGATGRQIAMQRRLVQSLTGRVGDEKSSNPRPAGRMRPTVAKGEAPVKVEEGHTLSGQRVTGTMVERSKLVTGNEPGAARPITGTEYIGAEQFDRLGSQRPPAGPAKVAIAETAKGKPVTGALVGRSPKVTGDESGATRVLTGTAYTAPADPSRAPEKVVLTHTAQGKAVTGTYVGHGSKMTGDERGACAKITGTEYLAAEQLRAECAIEPSAPPAKVIVSTSLGSQPVSGSAVGRSSKVTGDEPGACRPITGSQYYNTNDFSDLCAVPSPRRAASVMSRPVRANAAAEDAFPKSVGDAVAGAACATIHPFGLDRRNAVAAPDTAVAVIPARAVTGDRPGAGGSPMTGDERGACLPVSGTPYIGEDNAPAECPAPSGRSGRFVGRERPAPCETFTPGPLDFSIVSPAREAWQRRQSTLTGVGAGDERITGPINKAGGLVTGTPDFRHASKQSRVAAAEELPPAAMRLSGEGAQTGSRVTGDAWHAQSRVTGTEGASALARNPSQRGETRGAGAVGAREFRDIERQPVPESRVTGSSGNTTRGALVTVSGGARA